MIDKIKKTAKDNIEKMKKGEQIEKIDFRETLLNPNSGKTIEKTLVDLAKKYNDGSVGEELNNELTNLEQTNSATIADQNRIDRLKSEVEQIKKNLLKKGDQDIEKTTLPSLPSNKGNIR